jgi:mRNA-degrading endonuclease toxin of MazEF toxin-antitoxin module
LARILKGDIYSIDFGSIASSGREQLGFRPGLVVSGNEANERFPVITIAPITSKIKTLSEGYSLILEVEEPLPIKSEVLLYQLRTFDKNRLIKYRGSIKENQIKELNRLLIRMFNI